MPVYNGMPYLQELVGSLLAQTYRDLEIVFSDGGSTDGSLDLGTQKWWWQLEQLTFDQSTSG